MSEAIPTSARFWRDCLGVAAVIGVLAWLSLTFARAPGALTAIWFGNGILCGWLLSRPTPQWPMYVIAGFAAELAARCLVDGQLAHPVAIALCNVLEVLIVAIAVRHWVPDIGEPRHWVALGGIATVSTLLACAVSGLLAASANLWLNRGDFGVDFVTWYAAHVVGMVIFATSTVVMHREGWIRFTARGRRAPFVLTMLLIAVVGIAVFLTPYPVLYMAYPPLLMGAFRFRFAGVAVGVLVLGVVGSIATAMGVGPITMAHEVAHVALLQLYIGTACMMTIPVALVMAERQRLNVAVRESELRYRMLADYSHDVIVRMRKDGECVYVSPSVRDILGWAPAELVGSRWDLVHPDDRALQQETVREVLASGGVRTAVYRLRHKGGHYVWIEAITRPMPSPDLTGVDVIYTGRDISLRVAAEEALEASRQELERLLRVDTLTGVANRRQFGERLDLALMRLQRHGTPVAVMYLDIDYFKHINDTWGHGVGDQVLCAFAERLRGSVRATDLVARLGGDEFAVLVEDAALPEAAETIARKLVAIMARAIDAGEVAVNATTSIGIGYASAPTAGVRLLATADEALYAAKEAGRNTYRIRPVTDVRHDSEPADS